MTSNALYTVVCRELLSTAQPRCRPQASTEVPSCSPRVTGNARSGGERRLLLETLLLVDPSSMLGDAQVCGPPRLECERRLRSERKHAHSEVDSLQDHWGRQSTVSQTCGHLGEVPHQEARLAVLWLASPQHNGRFPGALGESQRVAYIVNSVTTRRMFCYAV